MDKSNRKQAQVDLLFYSEQALQYPYLHKIKIKWNNISTELMQNKLESASKTSGMVKKPKRNKSEKTQKKHNPISKPQQTSDLLHCF